MRRFLQGKIPEGSDLRVGSTPAVLRALGFKSGLMIMKAARLRKVIREHADLSQDALMNLTVPLADPEIVVSENGKASDALVIATMTLPDGRPIAIAMKLDGSTNNGQYATIVLTAFPYDDFTVRLQSYARNGQVFYVRDQSSTDKFELTGANSLKAPTEASVLSRAAPVRIVNRADVFKTDKDTSESRFDLAPIQDKFRGVIGSRHWQ